MLWYLNEVSKSVVVCWVKLGESVINPF